MIYIDPIFNADIVIVKAFLYYFLSAQNIFTNHVMFLDKSKNITWFVQKVETV